MNIIAFRLELIPTLFQIFFYDEIGLLIVIRLMTHGRISMNLCAIKVNRV